jgi:hypothetical protein
MPRKHVAAVKGHKLLLCKIADEESLRQAAEDRDVTTGVRERRSIPIILYCIKRPRAKTLPEFT